MSDAEVLESQAKSPRRRDFLFIATGVFATVGTAEVIAAGGPLNADLSNITPGQQIVVQWRGHQIFIVHRTAEALATLRNPALIAQLRGPDSEVLQPPPYAANWSRSINPQWAVLVGVCTQLGCIPLFEPNQGAAGRGSLGGWFFPCHGSKYDLAGRVYKYVPAPHNLPAPPYRMVNEKTLRVGENPAGENFSAESLTQL